MQPNKLKNIKFYNDEKIKIVSIIKFNNSIIEEYKKHTDDFIWDRVLKIKALIQENIYYYKNLQKAKNSLKFWQKYEEIKITEKEQINTPFFDRKFKLKLWNKKEYSFYECLDIWFERCKNI